MTAGVLLLAHGTPDSLDEMPDFLARVRDGRTPPPELVEEIRRHHAAIGGRSPLTDITRAQAGALREALGDGTPVYVGMRNWAPFIDAALAQAWGEGVRELVAIPMAPQYSRLSVGKYRAAVERATPAGMSVRFVESWHEHPGLLEAFAEKARVALERGPWDAVAFTAHSLPLRAVKEGDPYPDQVAATARGVAARVGIEHFRIAYQSAGRTPEPWLGPLLEQLLSELAVLRTRRLLVVPVGFVCDHTEVLYDIDVEGRALAQGRGIELQRSESLNASPAFIGALADVVRAHRA